MIRAGGQERIYMQIYEAFIRRVQQLRMQKGLTISDISDRGGLSLSTLRSIIYGASKNPGINNILKITRGLGVTLRDFFDSELFDNLWPED